MGYAEEANYPEQAATYDATRSASPTVVSKLLGFLGDPAGRTLLDVAGGTGNYSEALASHGFRPVVVDREPEMLARSIPKIGRCRQLVGDALRLPVHEGGVDAAMVVSALHQFPDQRGALVEARRVIRGGPFLLQAFTAESQIPTFGFEYFPGSDPPPGLHLSDDELVTALRDAGFGRVEARRFVYRDTADATFHALHVDPEALADAERLRNTSFFQRLPDASRRAGLIALRRDLESGRLADRVLEGLRLAAVHGHGTVFAAWP
jgi:SAM-dependent methyltransferase